VKIESRIISQAPKHSQIIVNDANHLTVRSGAGTCRKSALDSAEGEDTDVVQPALNGIVFSLARSAVGRQGAVGANFVLEGDS